MGITRQILKWTDKKADEAMNEQESVSKALRKTALSGFVEGMVDGAVVLYPVVLGACYYWRKQAEKK